MKYPFYRIGSYNNKIFKPKMSAIIKYIASLHNKSFAGIVEHFSSMAVNVHAMDDFYMLIASHNHSTYNEMSPLLQEVISQSVGTILEKETNRLVCFGFPKTQEITDTDNSPFSGPIMAHEYTTGTLIRAYYACDRWHISTNGTLDAYNSFWISNRSIGELFDECLCRIYKRSTCFATSPLLSFLIPGNTYMFILQHPEMHLENAERPFIYHLGTYNNTRMVYDYNIRADKLPKPRSYLFRNWDELNHTMQSLFTGFIFFPFSATSDQSPRYKLLTPKFRHHISLLGHTRNLYLRYLECKSEGFEHELLRNYPSIRKYSSWVEKSLQSLSNEIASVYIEKYVRWNYDISINFYHRPILTALREGRTHVSVASVYQHLSAYHPKKLNFILNGLQYIKTRDVHLPTDEENITLPVSICVPTPAPVPMALEGVVLTEMELDELDEALEKDIVSRRIGNNTVEEFLARLTPIELEDFLRPRIMPMLQNELSIMEETTSITYDEEHVFGLLLDHDYPTLAAAYEDDAILIPLIIDCAEISKSMPDW